MKGIMARWGISEKVISESGPCYNSKEFSGFAKEWDFNHFMISPYYNQSNQKSMSPFVQKFSQRPKRANETP